MKKKMYGLLLAMMLTVSLCACGGGGEASNSKAESSVTLQETAPSESAGMETADTAESTEKEETKTTEESKEEALTFETAKPGDVVDGIVVVPKKAPLEIPDNEALQFIRNLEIGWNLGNTFEASDCNWLSNEMDYESAWCGAKTTQGEKCGL